MTPTQLWQEFLAIDPQAGSEPEPWAFGAEADRLADLVARGIKTSTSSAHALYGVEREKMSQQLVAMTSFWTDKVRLCVLSRSPRSM